MQANYLETHLRELEEKRAELAARRKEEEANPKTGPRVNVSLYTPMNLGDGEDGVGGKVVEDAGLTYYLGRRRERLSHLAGGTGTGGTGRRAGVKGAFVPAPMPGA